MNFPIVQWTGDARAMHDTLRQGTPLVRTTIAQGKDLIVGGAEQCNIAVHAFHNARALARDIVERADFDPIAFGFLHYRVRTIHFFITC